MSSAVSRLLLPLVAGVGVLHVAVYAHLCTRDAVQVDFAAMYYAGATMRAGFDPYRNVVETRPDLWDGVASFRHSRYLYPPIVARALAPFSRLPYPVAKRVWTFASLIALAAATALVIRAAGVKTDPVLGWLVVISASLAFPLKPFIERGQIDAFTFLFIVGGFYLIFARRRDFAGGAVMAAAGFIKLQCFYLWPMLLVARRPRAAAGMAVGAVAIFGLQILLCGWTLTRQYVRDELPRISRGGEVGGESDRIDPGVIARVRGDLPPAQVLAGGHFRYRYTLLPDYAQTAGLVPYVRGAIRAATGFRPPTPAVSIPLLLAALAWMGSGVRRGVSDGPPGRLGFIFACLIVVLLTAPITWTTNLVWLSPAVAMLMLGPPGVTRALAAAGFVVLLLPDVMAMGVRPSRPWLGAVFGAQFLLALLLLLPYTLRAARGRVTTP